MLGIASFRKMHNHYIQQVLASAVFPSLPLRVANRLKFYELDQDSI